MRNIRIAFGSPESALAALKARAFMILALFSLAAGARAGTSPDPADFAFLTVTDTLSASTELFNNVQRKTRAVEIVGMTVPIDPTTGFNNLFNTYNNQPDIKTFTVYADTVIIRGRLVLPQTTVRIVAKNVYFLTLAGATDDTEIVTTPQALTQRPAGTSGTPGANGVKGGDIYLFWHSLTVDPQVQRGLNQDGAAGQPAGLGAAGAKGTSLAPYDGGNNFPSGWPAGTVYLFYLINGTTVQPVYGTTSSWPGNGHDAIAAGKPGEGGNGGNLLVTASTPFYTTRFGGQAGVLGLTTVGGAPGDPLPAQHVRYNPGSQTPYTMIEERSAVKGADAFPPSALNPAGNLGNLNIVGTTEPYMHPHVLKAIDAYTAATYAAGDIFHTSGFINGYLADYAAYKLTPNWTALPQADKNQAEAYKASMLARLADAAKNAAADWLAYP